MSVPHRDNPSPAVSQGPHHNDETSTQVPYCDKALFAQILLFHCAGEMPTGKHQVSIGKVQSSLRERDLALAFIPCIY
jgi:hypothetical protein